jgi:acyl-coenzyme A thioesterase PaaI-like protein
MSIKDKIFLKLYCFFRLPIISYCRPKIIKSDCDIVEIQIPLKRRTKNHLNSMYFGALSVGADFSGGLLVMNILRKNKSNAKLVFKDFKANFIKRATSDVLFVCKSSQVIQSSVIKNSSDKARVNFEIYVEAFCSGDLVADFYLTTSIK